LVTTAQQISLSPFPADLVTGSTVPPPTRYDEAAALPVCAPNASVTMSVPPEVKANPYGVCPEDGYASGPLRCPSAPTVKVTIESVPRSVTTSAEPSGVNATCAPSASGAESSRREPPIAFSVPLSIRKPVSVELPVLSA
jgi:hypothetical protein